MSSIDNYVKNSTWTKPKNKNLECTLPINIVTKPWKKYSAAEHDWNKTKTKMTILQSAGLDMPKEEYLPGNVELNKVVLWIKVLKALDHDISTNLRKRQIFT